jgi:ribonuclease T1
MLFLLAFFLSGTVQAKEVAHMDTVALSQLPPEVGQTIKLVKRGGPFPYPKDGMIFGNYEKSLPVRARGYYHEYTIRTPGIRGRGARRLIVGGEPSLGAAYYYTDDHYATFRRVRE